MRFFELRLKFFEFGFERGKFVFFVFHDWVFTILSYWKMFTGKKFRKPPGLRDRLYITCPACPEAFALPPLPVPPFVPNSINPCNYRLFRPGQVCPAICPESREAGQGGYIVKDLISPAFCYLIVNNTLKNVLSKTLQPSPVCFITSPFIRYPMSLFVWDGLSMFLAVPSVTPLS